MRYLVTGGNGFLGTHLCRELLESENDVVALDNFSTSSPSNVAQLRHYKKFEFIEADVCTNPRIQGSFDGIFHLACPASPDDYLRLPLETLAIGSHGSEFVLELAKRSACRVVLASTSEIYGEPLERPQNEAYWGNVNPIGLRSVYDESKRYSESIFAAYRRTLGVNTAIVRIFNTYGPGLRPRDGRVVSNFVAQAIRNEPLTIYGSGEQSRSFCFYSDLIEGLVRFMDSGHPGPINLGNPNEVTIRELASQIIEITNSSSEIIYAPNRSDDPTTRNPDIDLARSVLGWEPKVTLSEGLTNTVQWQQSLDSLSTPVIP